MLGWMLNRGGAASGGVSGGPDDTQIDAPDTPAPVFAARALKSALFGTPAAPATVRRDPKPVQNAMQPTLDMPSSTPSKPQGIMLTPGMGTARRKRVSFGRDVTQNDGKNGSKGGAASGDGLPGKVPTPWSEPVDGDRDASDGASRRRRTTLSERLENSRKPKAKSPDVAPAANASRQQPTSSGHDVDEAYWEEVADESDRELDADVTVDLNEPHSRSGKYWKTEFQKYHEEAKAEMEKLVKYKHLAKNYAKMKDVEALGLNQRLREEQSRVAEMEGQLAELARQIAAKRTKGSNDDNHDAVRELTRQTTLASQYRAQVKELESLIKDGQLESANASQGQGRRVVSLRTNQTLLEAQRELRRAREQVKELNQLKDEFRKSKADRHAAEQRELDLQAARDRLEADLKSARSRVEELTAKLTVAEQKTRRKTEALGKLQGDHDRLKEESRKSAREARAALRAKDEEIARLRALLEKKQQQDAVTTAKDVDGQGSSGPMSEELDAPYSADRGGGADWTVDVTQLEDKHVARSNNKAKRHLEAVTMEPEVPEATGDTSGWTQRLHRLEARLESEQPLRATETTKPKSQAKRVPVVATADDTIEEDNFTQRLAAFGKDLGKDTGGGDNNNKRRTTATTTTVHTVDDPTDPAAVDDRGNFTQRLNELKENINKEGRKIDREEAARKITEMSEHSAKMRERHKSIADIRGGGAQRSGATTAADHWDSADGADGYGIEDSSPLQREKSRPPPPPRPRSAIGTTRSRTLNKRGSASALAERPPARTNSGGGSGSGSGRDRAINLDLDQDDQSLDLAASLRRSLDSTIPPDASSTPARGHHHRKSVRPVSLDTHVERRATTATTSTRTAAATTLSTSRTASDPLAKTTKRHPSAASDAEDEDDEDDDKGIDLLQGRFARLGGPGGGVSSSGAGGVGVGIGGRRNDPFIKAKGADAADADLDAAVLPNSSVVGTINTTSRSSALPPSRHAAALARLEQKRVERRRKDAGGGAGAGHDKENVVPY